VQQPQRGPFFDRNGLLLPLAEFRATGEGLARAQPLLASIAADPSFGGVLAALSNSLQDVKYGQVKLGDIQLEMTALAESSARADCRCRRHLCQTLPLQITARRGLPVR